MNGLRMFTPAGPVVASSGSPVFYSRRSEGPYYRWSYEQKLEQWRPARVPTDQLSHLSLSASRWKNIPSALQRSLVEHYLE